jgi:hypothetical protein
MTLSSIIKIPGSFPPAAQAAMDRFPSDTYQEQLAALATLAGITHIMDPAFYSGGVNDLVTSGSWSAEGSPALDFGTPINSQPVLNFVAPDNHKLTSTFTKAESSWSVMMFFKQVAADQLVTTNKVLVSAGLDNMYLRNTGYNGSVSAGWTLRFAETVSSFTLAYGSYVMLISFDGETNAFSVRGSTDNVLASGTSASDVPDGSPWYIGATSASNTSFSGQIGMSIFFDKALHLAENDDVRQLIQGIMRSKYGL